MLGLVGCRAPAVTQIDVHSGEDRDQGMVLRLELEKETFEEGEEFVATATLENLGVEPLAVHYLIIEPIYMSAPPLFRPGPTDPLSRHWRYAYFEPFVLDMPGSNTWGGLISRVGVMGNPAEAKDDIRSLLSGASYGCDYPPCLIPGRSEIRARRTFVATKDKNYIDVGLFCLPNYYTEKTLKKSEQGMEPGRLEKTIAKIWLGSLYVGLRINVE